MRFIERFRPNKPPILKDELIERFDLDTKKRIKDYSKGNRQKLAIIQATMHDPQLLLLDEPTSGLDPFMQQEFYNLLKEFKSRGHTIFISSHILPEIERVCDRVGIIKDGFLTAIERIGDLAEKKVRYIEVEFAESVNARDFRLPGVVSVDEINGRFRMTVRGDIEPVIKKIAEYRVKDLISTPASLEEVFLAYYERDKTDEH